MVPVLAFSLQDQAETYGAYVGIAAFIGLAVLSLLYFAQARELKRLRDWAGRSPERAQELEARVVAQAEEARQPPVPAPARSGAVGPAQPVKPAVATGNGRAAGAPVPVIAMGPRPAVAVAAAAAPAPAEAEQAPPAGDDAAVPPVPAAEGDAVAPPTPAAGDDAAAPPVPAAQGDAVAPPAAAGAPEAEQPAPAGNGAAAQPTPPPQIPRATPRPQPRRVPPAAPVRAPSRSATVPPRRGTPPPRRTAQPVPSESPVGRIILISLLAVLVIGAGAFGATRLLGGEDPAPPPNRTADPANETPQPTGDGAASAEDTRADAVVAVLNGTVITGLASGTRDKLVAKGYSEEQGMIRTGDNTDQQRQDSVVLYAEGERRQARDIATILDIDAIEQMDEETQALANNADTTGSGESVDVAVITGADQSP